jgi:L-alanine-DL-glutamate epimerase-like enolase superfamily enzyme
MKIEAVDFFYLTMPIIRDIGDGSQDALLVRIQADGHEGWGECEASPLVTMAAWNCPMSHSACKPVSASVLGHSLNDPKDIARIHQLVRKQSLDLLQTDHLLSGIDIALWDLMGKKLETPVYRLLGYNQAFPKLPYASQLFGDTPQQTLEKAKAVRANHYRAAKFGWGPYGQGTVEQDHDHVHAAREGLGPDGILLIDAGTVWQDDVEAASQRLKALQECRVTWLEEPFISAALGAYHQLSLKSNSVKLAGGEGCHQAHQAFNMMDYAGLGYIQIDTGRVGGISPAFQVAQRAAKQHVTYVNHTFTSYLALSASIQPYAGLESHQICEYPVEATTLARKLTQTSMIPDEDGMITVPEAPGLGLTIDPETIDRYRQEVQIKVNNRIAFESTRR